MAKLPVDHDETPELTPEQEAAIEESLAEIARGDYVTAEQMLEKLRATRDSKLLAELDASMEEVERGEFGRPLDEILAEFRRSSGTPPRL